MEGARPRIPRELMMGSCLCSLDVYLGSRVNILAVNIFGFGFLAVDVFGFGIGTRPWGEIGGG